MWQVNVRRRRNRWLAIGFLLLVFVWCFILYKSLSFNYENESPEHVHSHSIASKSAPFLFEIDNLEVFLNKTPVKYNYHIFYYPWYGNPEFDSGQYLHWNHRRLPHWNRETAARFPQTQHIPPDDIGSNYYPLLGAYSSRSPDIIDKHMRMIRMSGAGTLAISWYPPGMADDNGKSWEDLVPVILNKAAKYKLKVEEEEEFTKKDLSFFFCSFQIKVCFHIEPYKDRTAANVITWSYYIFRHYGPHAAFYNINGKGVFYIYDSYQISVDDWRKNLLHRKNDPNAIGYFIGLILKPNDCKQLASSGFHAAYSYFAANSFTEASNSKNWRSIARECQPISFIPSVGPGYIDTNIRPWNSETIRSRNDGKYYRQMFDDIPQTDDMIVSITSFNEWHEGTQIEPAIDKQPSNIITYEKYHQGPWTYIYLTRELIFR